MSSEIRHLTNALNLLIEGTMRADDSNEHLAAAIQACLHTLHDWSGNLAPDGGFSFTHDVVDDAVNALNGEVSPMVADLQAVMADNPEVIAILTKYDLLP